MKIGLIGLGYWGKNIYRNLVNSSQIDKIYVLDIDSAKLKDNKNLHIYSSSNKFFNNKDIDAFIISTPTATHYKYLKKCLEIDKNVCVTKPITINYSQILKLKKGG